MLDFTRMMGSVEPDAEELIVKAQYFLPIETSEENLRSVQNRLTQIMMEEGYHTDDAPTPFLVPDRTMKFIIIPPTRKKTLWDRFKTSLGVGGEDNPLADRDVFLDGLERLVDDVPFRLVFRFRTFQGDDVDGYDLFVESTPVLLQKSRQLRLHPDYDYNMDNIVDQNKREITRILGRLGIEPTRGPYTEAESLDTRLSEETVNELEEHLYGRTAVRYINEGDQSLQQNLLHAALSCYIQGIEWIILYFKATEEDEDLVEQQQVGNIEPVYFSDLVDELYDTPASQKTVSKLKNFNQAERRWIAHHKSGKLQRQDVENVRSTLLRLAEELL